MCLITARGNCCLGSVLLFQQAHSCTCVILHNNNSSPAGGGMYKMSGTMNKACIFSPDTHAMSTQSKKAKLTKYNETHGPANSTGANFFLHCTLTCTLS